MCRMIFFAIWNNKRLKKLKSKKEEEEEEEEEEERIWASGQGRQAGVKRDSHSPSHSPSPPSLQKKLRKSSERQAIGSM